MRLWRPVGSRQGDKTMVETAKCECGATKGLYFYDNRWMCGLCFSVAIAELQVERDKLQAHLDRQRKEMAELRKPSKPCFYYCEAVDEEHYFDSLDYIMEAIDRWDIGDIFKVVPIAQQHLSPVWLLIVEEDGLPGYAEYSSHEAAKKARGPQ